MATTTPTPIRTSPMILPEPTMLLYLQLDKVKGDVMTASLYTHTQTCCFRREWVAHHKPKRSASKATHISPQSYNMARLLSTSARRKTKAALLSSFVTLTLLLPGPFALLAAGPALLKGGPYLVAPLKVGAPDADGVARLDARLTQRLRYFQPLKLALHPVQGE